MSDIVLGAGIVGTCMALHLRRLGRDVMLIDRAAPGRATSFGNAGLIERSDVMPRTFPRGIGELAAYALGRDPKARLDYKYLPQLTSFLFNYWRASAPDRARRLPGELAPLFLASVEAHLELMREADAMHLFRANGWLHLYRTSEVPRDMSNAVNRARDFGMQAEIIDGEEAQAREPALRAPVRSAVHWVESASVTNPGELTRLYAERFQALGGKIQTARLTAIEPAGSGWQAITDKGKFEGENLVVALGPWADDFIKPLGYRYPLAVKRGYHLHYAAEGENRPHLPVIDSDAGIALNPMEMGVRMTTGIEFAGRDAPPSPVQTISGEVAARQLLALGGRVEQSPWMGCRPVTADMKPVIGQAPRHKGLWFNFGHAHHGLTLGPISGRVLADRMAGREAELSLEAFSPRRFEQGQTGF